MTGMENAKESRATRTVDVAPFGERLPWMEAGEVKEVANQRERSRARRQGGGGPAYNDRAVGNIRDDGDCDGEEGSENAGGVQ